VSTVKDTASQTNSPLTLYLLHRYNSTPGECRGIQGNAGESRGMQGNPGECRGMHFLQIKSHTLADTATLLIAYGRITRCSIAHLHIVGKSTYRRSKNQERRARLYNTMMRAECLFLFQNEPKSVQLSVSRLTNFSGWGQYSRRRKVSRSRPASLL
jgi:hypothetical protein